MNPDDLKQFAREVETQGKPALDKLIAAIDTLVLRFGEMKVQVDKSFKLVDDAQTIAINNQKAALDLTETIKNIHIALNAHRDVLPEEIKMLTNELGKFVMTGAAIKAGVIRNANSEG